MPEDHYSTFIIKFFKILSSASAIIIENISIFQIVLLTAYFDGTVPIKTNTFEILLLTTYSPNAFKYITIWNMISPLYNDGSVNSQEYKSCEISADIIKISMTEVYHWINRQANGLF